ncbi:Histidine kinase-like ATPase domain-containing protein [Blastococcus aggregatus]|uniref:Histidine kinase-like ATPase domain-containing protein n=1 Tax=Blastococcus aggregatus TaxID=38502 RepID=A0A285V3P1_9ACTN|nr:ATP-binding protein [Blastococcus aggregatus]SOC47121.1 Histidine kinase-like ATPase domain-containing protein [Blastococcus aggregatus]
MPSRSFPAYPGSVPDARRYVADALADLSDRPRETAELLVSELVTNAVRHGSGPRVEVSVDVLPGERICIGVTDDGDGYPVQRSPRVTDEHGRGLHLVGLLADRWGVRRTSGGDAKTVWFELAVTRTSAGSSPSGTTVDDV